jgi:hypothetical protein
MGSKVLFYVIMKNVTPCSLANIYQCFSKMSVNFY